MRPTPFTGLPLGRRQKSVYRLFEDGVRLSADDHPLNLHPRAVLFQKAQEEGRRPPNAGPLSLFQVLTDSRGIFSFFETLSESREIQSEPLSVPKKVLHGERPLIGEELSVHLPELALLARAPGRFGCLERIAVIRQRKIPHDIANLSRLNVFSFDLRPRLPDVARAERSLIIGELHKQELRRRIAL